MLRWLTAARELVWALEGGGGEWAKLQGGLKIVITIPGREGPPASPEESRREGKAQRAGLGKECK